MTPEQVAEVLAARTPYRCTCLPLNRRLMAHLLKVDEGSVHEQDCVDRAVAVNLADEWQAVAEAARMLAAWPWPNEPIEMKNLRAALDALDKKQETL